MSHTLDNQPSISEPAAAGGSTQTRRAPIAGDGTSVIDDLMAGGELLPTQLPSATYWSPERKLAGAVLASALIEIRDHHGSRTHHRRVVEALEWVASDDGAWPFAFQRLCALFDLDPDWVRAAVRYWVVTPRTARKGVPFLYRQAA